MSVSSPSIDQRFTAGKLYKLAINGEFNFSLHPPRNYRSNGSLEKLIEDSVDVLKLPGQAKHAYTEDGKKVKSLDDIQSNTILFISCGEKFKNRPSPDKAKQWKAAKEEREREKTPKNDQEPKPKKVTIDPNADGQVLKSPTSKNQSDAMSTRSEAFTAITVSNKPKSRYARYHQLLAVLPGSVEDHIRDSMLATYTTMDEEMRNGLENGLIYQEMLTATQIHLFAEQLSNQNMCPPTSDSPVSQDLADFAFKIIDERPISNYNIAILGPRYSGKTMILHSVAMTTYRKLLNSDLHEDYLMFPLNLQLHQIYMDDPVQFYPIIINIAFNSARYARFELLPYLLPLRQWFLQASTIGTMTKLPAGLAEMPHVSLEALTELGKELHNCFHKPDGLKNFYQLIFEFPNKFAQAIGLKSAFMIVDHFDCGLPVITKSISAAIKDSPYILGSQTDSLFYKVLKVPKKQIEEITTENLITYADNRQIFIAELSIKIGIEQMMGCPGFITSFVHICDMVEKFEEKTAISSKYATIMAKIDTSRRVEIFQEFNKLCLALANGNNEVVTFDMLNALNDEPLYNIKIAHKGGNKQQSPLKKPNEKKASTPQRTNTNGRTNEPDYLTESSSSSPDYAPRYGKRPTFSSD